MFSPFDIVIEGNIFSGGPLSTMSVCSFVWTDVVTTISHEHEEVEQSQWNLKGIFTTFTDDVIRFLRSEVKVIAGRRGGRGIASVLGHETPIF